MIKTFSLITLLIFIVKLVIAEVFVLGIAWILGSFTDLVINYWLIGSIVAGIYSLIFVVVMMWIRIFNKQADLMEREFDNFHDEKW